MRITKKFQHSPASYYHRRDRLSPCRIWEKKAPATRSHSHFIQKKETKEEEKKNLTVCVLYCCVYPLGSNGTAKLQDSTTPGVIRHP